MKNAIKNVLLTVAFVSLWSAVIYLAVQAV
jgi:hypothetical protein